jgi:hypothetical protein
MASDTYLTEDAGLPFWALWKEMAEQLKIQKKKKKKKRQLARTEICPILFGDAGFAIPPSTVLLINIIVLLL